jgi:Putative bacterial sensory transduction regulator
MPASPIANPEERAKCADAIAAWAAQSVVDSTGSVKAPAVLAVESDPELDRWYVRLKGEEKDVVTIWLTVRQRTLRHEAHFMPAPETNLEQTYEYLLRRNSSLLGMRFCLGEENAVFLVGEIPVAEVTVDEIDRIVGTSLEYVDTCFPAAMTLGYETAYKRRRRR